MKKLILSMLALTMFTIVNAQVQFAVLPPSGNAGSYENTFAPSGGDWGVADLNDPLNSIQGFMAFVDDGTADDSLGCNPLVNNAALAGKIAVVYRGACQFGTKAFNAQNAGAIGVIIINNAAGSPVGMAGGTDGLSVTIPVIMIANTTGAILKSEIAAGNTEAFIGNKNGLYANDLGNVNGEFLKPEFYAIPKALATDSNDFRVQFGAWVKNYGNEDQSNVTVSVDVTANGSSVFSTTSANVLGITSGDSVFVAITDELASANYTSGVYDVTYTITADSADQFAGDNVFSADFVLSDSTLSYARINPTSNYPLLPSFNRPGGDPIRYEQCIHFRDANASKLELSGMTFSFAFDDGSELALGRILDIKAYEMTDNFVDVNDTLNYSLANLGLNEVASGLHVYSDPLEERTDIYTPFITPVTLVDNQRYLFCVQLDSGMFLGSDNYGYSANINEFLQPHWPIRAGDPTSWSFTTLLGFTGFTTVPGISATFNDLTPGVGLEENNITNEVSKAAYPNPARDFIQIPMNLQKGFAELTITDLSGKAVSSQTLNVNDKNVQVDIRNIAQGTYIFNITDASQERKSFKVFISR